MLPIVNRMRAALRRHVLDIRDNGLIPEGSPIEGFDASRAPQAYPMERILDVADTAIRRDPVNLARPIRWLADDHECIRYWAALGCVMLRERAARAADALTLGSRERSGPVRVAAAEALCYTGRQREGLAVLQNLLLEDASPWIRLQAAHALQNVGPTAAAVLPAIEKAVSDGNDYVQRASRYAAAALKHQP